MSNPKKFVEEHEQLNKILKTSKRGFFSIVTGRTFVIFILLALQIGLLFWGFDWLGRRMHLFYGGSTVLAAVMLVYLLNTRHDPTVKLTWCVIVAIVPVFGTLLYIFIKLDLGHRAVRHSIQRTILETARLFPDQRQLMERLKNDDREAYGFATYLKKNGFPVYENSWVKYYPLGEDKFRDLLIELNRAKRFISWSILSSPRGTCGRAYLRYWRKKPGPVWRCALCMTGHVLSQTCPTATLSFSAPRA